MRRNRTQDDRRRGAREVKKWQMSREERCEGGKKEVEEGV